MMLRMVGNWLAGSHTASKWPCGDLIPGVNLKPWPSRIVQREWVVYRAQCLLFRPPLGASLILKNVEWKEKGTSERVKDKDEEHTHKKTRTSSISDRFCLYRRDGSASATYFFKDQSAAEIRNKTWLYLRTLGKGEEEFPLRNEQARCGKKTGGWCPQSTGTMMTLVNWIVHMADRALKSPHFPSPKLCGRVLWGITLP